MSQTNPRIKVLRVNDISSKSNQTTDKVIDGQPVYDKATKRLLVGDGGVGSELTNTSNNWLDSNTNNTSKETKLWIGTEAEYNNITTKDSNTLYFIKES